MPNLKDLKNRIESVKSTRKITKAMQMVAAAKLRRAQEAAEAGRPYAERFNAVLGSLAAASSGGNAPALLAGSGSDQVHMLVVMTAERGLCGGFNSSIVKMARAKAEELTANGKTVKILTVGKKGREQMKRDFEDQMVDHVDLSAVRNVGYANAQAVANDLIHRFNEGEFDVATIFYNKFESVISQIPTATQVIPASFDAPEEGADASVVYDYEPSEEGILKTLLPSGVATQIFSALLENAASEQGARMSAMDNATRNAGEMIDKLTIEFNRSRQAVITNELIEIISGAEAL
ncbi:F0F1 ATP synthase subunit gamma [Aliiroseovarius crassostreae]|uniref:F0F1 ATP synthase subunit gamma n=1 Tax=Aliiroseovarius crassostreae TaxID=154981 RepID=UPI003C7A5A38